MGALMEDIAEYGAMRPASSVSPSVVDDVVLNPNEYYVSPKVDGTYCIMEYGKFYNRHGDLMTDRTPHVIANDVQPKQPFEGRKALRKVDGSPITILSQLSHLLANPDVHELFKERWSKSIVHGELYNGTFYPFDIIEYNKMYCGNTPFGERRKIVTMWMDYAVMLDQTLAQQTIRPHISDFINNKEDMYQQSVPQQKFKFHSDQLWRHLPWPKIEGFVLKHKDSYYCSGNNAKIIKCRWE